MKIDNQNYFLLFLRNCSKEDDFATFFFFFSVKYTTDNFSRKAQGIKPLKKYRSAPTLTYEQDSFNY